MEQREKRYKPLCGSGSTQGEKWMKKENWKKNTAMFLTSQAISLLGSSIVQFSIVWYVAKETQSGLMMTLITLCSFLPQVLVSAFAGVWADRYSRKLIIVSADAGIAVITLVLAFIIMNGGDFFWALLVISAVRSFGTGIQMPAVHSAIPQLVPHEHLMKVNGINSSVQSAINIVAPAAAGAVLSMGAFHYVMFIDVITAAIGISIMLAGVPLKKGEKTDECMQSGHFDDMKAGVAYMMSNKFLKRVLLISGIFCFLVAPGAFLNTLVVTRLFEDNYFYLTLNEISFFIGAVLGGTALSMWGGFPNRLKTLGYGGLVFGVTSIAIGLVHDFWIYLIIIGITGFAMPFNSTPLTVLLQEKVAPEMLGRVFSILQIVSTLVMLLGMAFFGPLSDKISLRWLMISSGIGLILMTNAVFMWKSFYKEGFSSNIMPEETCKDTRAEY